MRSLPLHTAPVPVASLRSKRRGVGRGSARGGGRWFYNSWEKRDAFAREQRTLKHGTFSQAGAVSGKWFGALKGDKIPEKFRD